MDRGETRPAPWWRDYVKWGPSAVLLMAAGTAWIDAAWIRAIVSVWLIVAADGLGEVRGLRFAGKPFAGDTIGRRALPSGALGGEGDHG